MSRIRTLSTLFALALVVRLAAAFVVGIGGPLVEDERGYVQIARALHNGDGFALSVPTPPGPSSAPRGSPLGPVRRTAFRAPGWPVLLAPLPAAGAVPWAFRLMAALFGALGPPLLYLGLRAGGAGRAAFLAALGYAVWPPHVYLSTRALSEPASQAFLLAAVFVVLRSRSAGSPDARACAGAGVLAAVAVLIKPAALLPCLLLAFTVGSRRRALAFSLGLVVLLAPWVARNAALHGRALFTTNSGVTLVGGNSAAAAAAAHPGKWVHPNVVYAGAEDPPDYEMWGWSDLGEEASDRRFTRDAVSWVADNPGDATVLTLWKVVRLFDPDPRSSKPDAGRKRLLGWLSLPPVMLLALLGAWSVRGRRREFGPWYALIAGTVVTAAVFYGDARMRTAADPALLALAAAGALSVAGRLGGSSRTE